MFQADIPGMAVYGHEKSRFNQMLLSDKGGGTMKHIFYSLILVFAVVCHAAFDDVVYGPARNTAVTEKYLLPGWVDIDNNGEDKNFEALFGDDDSAQGFITLVGKYLNPNNNNNVMFYSGLCLKNIGYYDSALQYLLPLEQKYIADKIVTYRLLGCIGDIYVQLKKYTDAEIYYNKAINCGYYCDSDKLVYLFKLIRLYEHLDLHKKAYNLIDDFISQHSKTQKYKELVDEKRKLEIEINKVQSNPIL